MRLTRRSEAAVEPPRHEPVPGLEAARRAAAEAGRREADLALEIQACEVEGQSAALVRGRVASRVAAGGGTARQADVDAVASAEAVIAGVPARVAILQDAQRLAEAETKAAERRVARILTAELHPGKAAAVMAGLAAAATLGAAMAGGRASARRFGHGRRR